MTKENFALQHSQSHSVIADYYNSLKKNIKKERKIRLFAFA